MHVLIDFEDAGRQGDLPNHGWANNSQNCKLLWFPILRLMSPISISNIRTGKGLENPPDARYSDIRLFEQTTRKLCVSLRETAKYIRLAGNDPGFNETDVEIINIAWHAKEVLPLQLDMSFLLLRRLADHMARSLRFILFKNWNSAPMEYKNLKTKIEDDSWIEQLEPICNIEALRRAILSHSNWFDSLRNITTIKDINNASIRDRLEHYNADIVASHISQDGENWYMFATLGDSDIHRGVWTDLLTILRDNLTDLCRLWNGLCLALNLQPAERLGRAPYGDAVLLLGNDDDTTYFWPESHRE